MERVGKDRDDIPFVILHAGDENAKLKIECFFDDADEEEEGQIERLDKGQTITVRGEYGGRVSNLYRIALQGYHVWFWSWLREKAPSPAATTDAKRFASRKAAGEGVFNTQ
ncbi:MAG: hypothetical protein L0241_07875 [Planctomycetia bacterium]|nr:hypothetical protein [Planctomycetia bacterium]